MGDYSLSKRRIPYEPSLVGILMERFCDGDFLYRRSFYTRQRGTRLNVELGPVWVNGDRYKARFHIPQDKSIPIEDRINQRYREIFTIAPYSSDRMIILTYDLPKNRVSVQRQSLDRNIKSKRRNFTVRDRTDLDSLETYIHSLLPVTNGTS